MGGQAGGTGQTWGGATHTHRTWEPHQEGQGRVQQTRRRGTTRQEKQPEQREQGAKMERMGERAHGRQQQQRGWHGQLAPLLPGAKATPAQPPSGGGCLLQPRWAVCATGAGAHEGQGKRTYGGRPRQRMEEQGTWATHTQKHSEASYGRLVDRGAWTAKTIKRHWQQPAHPQYATYWAPLTRKRHTMPHSAQPQHTNYWAPRTRVCTALCVDSRSFFAPLCDILSDCCSFTGPWTDTRSSLHMLRRVAAFCRPLWPDASLH